MQDGKKAYFRQQVRGRLALLLALISLSWMAPVALAASQAEAERTKMFIEAERMVFAGDFKAIDQRVQSDLKSQARFSDGLWRASLFYSAFQQALHKRYQTEDEWNQAFASLATLTKASPHAFLLLEQALHARAWSIRGSGVASTVDPAAWQQFLQYLASARSVLDANKAQLTAYPAWYSMRITIATELGEGAPLIEALFEEGMARHPTYHAIYFARMRSLSPSWDGSRSDQLALLRQIASLKGKAKEEALYVRLVWVAESSGDDLIYEKQLDADALKASSGLLAKTYPDQGNLQKLFLFACQRSDKESAEKLLTTLVDPPVVGMLEGGVGAYRTCREWAAGTLPAFVIRERRGGQMKEYLIR